MNTYNLQWNQREGKEFKKLSLFITLSKNSIKSKWVNSLLPSANVLSQIYRVHLARLPKGVFYLSLYS